MSIFRKLNTLLRASARETAEHITDANAIRIYRQEVIDAENLLGRRRACLAAIIATRKGLEREIASAQTRIQSRERQIAAVTPGERTEELLLLAARDIAIGLFIKRPRLINIKEKPALWPRITVATPGTDNIHGGVCSATKLLSRLIRQKEI